MSFNFLKYKKFTPGWSINQKVCCIVFWNKIDLYLIYS